MKLSSLFLSAAVTVLAGTSLLAIGGASDAHAGYRGSGPACVVPLAAGDRLNVRVRPHHKSRRLGQLNPGQCGMNIEAVEGNWTFIRGADHRGRNIQGWVNNNFLEAKQVSAPPVNRVAYTCNEGIPLIVTFVNSGADDHVLYSHDSGPEIRLSSAQSGSGFRYSDGVRELHGKGDDILVIENGDVIDSCRAG